MRRRQPRPVRLIGVSVGSLTAKGTPKQLSLFELQEGESSQREVDKVVDSLSDQIGGDAVYRATSHSGSIAKSRCGPTSAAVRRTDVASRQVAAKNCQPQFLANP